MLAVFLVLTPWCNNEGIKIWELFCFWRFSRVYQNSDQKIYDGGRFINDEDIEQERKVCVIGERTQKELFDEDENPIGRIYWN